MSSDEVNEINPFDVAKEIVANKAQDSERLIVGDELVSEVIKNGASELDERLGELMVLDMSGEGLTSDTWLKAIHAWEAHDAAATSDDLAGISEHQEDNDAANGEQSIADVVDGIDDSKAAEEEDEEYLKANHSNRYGTKKQPGGGIGLPFNKLGMLSNIMDMNLSSFTDMRASNTINLLDDLTDNLALDIKGYSDCVDPIVKAKRAVHLNHRLDAMDTMIGKTEKLAEKGLDEQTRKRFREALDRAHKVLEKACKMDDKCLEKFAKQSKKAMESIARIGNMLAGLLTGKGKAQGLG